MKAWPLLLIAVLVVPGTGGQSKAGQEQIVRVELAYAAPGSGPAPNFSPKGTQIPLSVLDPKTPLPADAVINSHVLARTGTIKVGPGQQSWVTLIATADPAHPADFTRLYLDRNRNGNYEDDGPAVTAEPIQNEKTKAWWTSHKAIELSLPYAGGAQPEPYLVNFWSVRDDAAGTTAEPAQVLRYSVGSWRSGSTTINGTNALVAAMDGDNNAIFDKADRWSVLEAGAPDAAKLVLSHAEARETTRLMYVNGGGREQVLEFRSFAPDGRWIEFAVVDRMSTKKADRAADDVLAVERNRPRATTPFAWSQEFAAALSQSKKQNRKLVIDFEATWCGPCKTMDEWIWTDAEVAGILTAGFVGVKIDGDLHKELADRLKVTGYPTMIVLNPNGTESHRFSGYLNSADAIAFLKR
jgi:thiol-disulfide isomerase/thioredoxin